MFVLHFSVGDNMRIKKIVIISLLGLLITVMGSILLYNAFREDMYRYVNYIDYVSEDKELPKQFKEVIANKTLCISRYDILFPVEVTIDDFSNNRLFYTIHYWPMGTLKMSYSAIDGYSTEGHLKWLMS